MTRPLTAAQVAALRELAKPNSAAWKEPATHPTRIAWMVNKRLVTKQVLCLAKLGFIEDHRGFAKVITSKGREYLATLDAQKPPHA